MDQYPGRRYATTSDFYEGSAPGWVKVPKDEPPYRIGARWFLRTMQGCVIGTIGAQHQVAEHEDGTISVEPSLIFKGGWHGFLRRGIFEVLDYGRPPVSTLKSE